MKSGTRIFSRRWLFIVSLMVGSCLVQQSALAGQVPNEDATPSTPDATKLIGELNQVAFSSDFMRSPAATNSAVGIGLNKKCWAIREQLALQGVCVRYQDGAFAHATREALNGFSLKPDELKSLAFLNYLEQSEREAERFIKGYKRSGETRTLIPVVMGQLTGHGISVKWNGDLYVVQSVRTNPGIAADAAGQQTNLTPTNASTPSPEK